MSHLCCCVSNIRAHQTVNTHTSGTIGLLVRYPTIASGAIEVLETSFTPKMPTMALSRPIIPQVHGQFCGMLNTDALIYEKSIDPRVLHSRSSLKNTVSSLAHDSFIVGSIDPYEHTTLRPHQSDTLFDGFPAPYLAFSK